MIRKTADFISVNGLLHAVPRRHGEAYLSLIKNNSLAVVKFISVHILL